MKLMIDVEEVPSVSALKKYISLKNWSFHSQSDKSTTYFSEDTLLHYLVIPNSEDYSDYERRVIEILQMLSTVEKRDEYSIYKDIIKLDVEKWVPSPEVMTKYLKIKGWKRDSAEYYITFSLESEEGFDYIDAPIFHIENYEREVRHIISALSEIEERSESKILEELKELNNEQ